MKLHHRSRRSTSIRVESLAKRFRVSSANSKVVRYAVVGLGHIAQVAVLPAFAHAKRNSRLVALFSDDKTKLKELGKRYKVPMLGSYHEYDSFLRTKQIDAVYIALPNSMHREFTVRAAKAGVHVLCEKPLGVTAQDCETMIAACRKNRVKLMTAYRLHFEKSNLEAIKVLRSGKLGEVRYFNSIFSMQARSPNIRLDSEKGGGPLRDLGIYCINAARYLLGEEPTEVLAMTASGKDKRFREVEEMVGATLRFPGERLANFICSFGANDAGRYEVAGTKGKLTMDNAYEYVAPMEMEITVDDKTQSRTFEQRDQFAPELIYFSDCVLRNRDPEPSGTEGLLDLKIIDAIYRSARISKPVKISAARKRQRPSLRQEIKRPPVKKPELVNAQAGSR
jgi:predicted dehydrogenase